MNIQHSNALNEIYDLFVSKIESMFNVNNYSSNYEKLDGELTLTINNNELSVGFGSEVTVIINFGTKRQQRIPLEFDYDEWFVIPYTDWNNSEKPTKFDEKYLDKILRHFTEISK